MTEKSVPVISTDGHLNVLLPKLIIFIEVGADNVYTYGFISLFPAKKDQLNKRIQT